MRLFLIVLITMAGLKTASAQKYYAIRNDGALPSGYYLDKVYDPAKTILLNQPSSQVLSDVAQIPFSFYFNGEAFTAYKVCENGYLTFDTLSTTAEIPDTNLPEKSIVVFGKDFKLQKLPQPNDGIGTQVFSYTVGQAPNRRHIIQYYGLSLANDFFDKPINNASIYAFAIILHEGSEGRFDLVYSPYGNKDIKGAIGCNSALDTQKFLLYDSLSLLPFQFSFDLSKFIVYQIMYGVQPEYDVVIKDMKLAKIYPVNAIVNFTGIMSNWGSREIHSYMLNYSANGGDTVSFLIDQLNLLPDGRGSMTFNHPFSWQGGAAGSLNNLNFWLSLPDNFPDGNDANSHFAGTILRNNNVTTDRNILLEEGTGAWCGYCPDAHLLVSKAVELHGKRVIPVSYHFDDSMSNQDAYNFLIPYIKSYPDAMLDRKVQLGSNSTWLNEINSRLNVRAPAEISVGLKLYNPQTRTITYRISVRFLDYWYGNLRIGSIVTENTNRGSANPNIWSQNNYYSKFHNGGGVGGSSHPLYNELEYMDGYLHSYVHKASPGGVWGVPGIIPELVSPNSVYTYDFSYVLPPAAFVNYQSDNNTPYCSTLDGPGQNEGRNIPAAIRIIGYLSEYDADYFSRPVLNAVIEPLWDLSAVNALQASSDNISVFPNPARDIATVKFNLKQAAQVSIQVYNSYGQLVYSEDQNVLNQGENYFFINSATFSPGVYTIRLTGGGDSASVNLVIAE